MCISNMIMLTMATIDFTKLKKLMPMFFFLLFVLFSLYIHVRMYVCLLKMDIIRTKMVFLFSFQCVLT